MKNLAKIIFISTLLSACTHTEIGDLNFPDGQVQHAVLAEDIEWMKCPTHLPPGCELSVLEGNPKEPDLFTVRFRIHDGFVMRPHTHPKHERVTILSGKVSVAFGLDAKHEDATQFGPGDYYVNAKDTVHSVWVDEPTILQVTGIGPWEANFVDIE